MAQHTKKVYYYAAKLFTLILTLALVTSGCSKVPQASKPGAQGVSERGSDLASQDNGLNVVGVRRLPNNVGWAWGSQADKLTLLRTTDAGAKWQSVKLPTPPELKESGGPGGVAAYFTDANHGWLAFASANDKLTIYRTDNAGKSWQKSTAEVKGLSAQIQFVGNNNGWMLLHQGAAMMHEEVSVIRTTDGGTTWQVVSKVPPNSSNPPPGSIPYAGDKNGISFKDANTGYLTAFTPESGRAFIYTTSDSGRTWQPKSISIAKEFTAAELSAMPPLFFCVTKGVLPVIVNTQKQALLFYTTNDGGKAWSPGTPVKSAMVQPWVWSFSDVDHGFVTDGQQFYATVDAGKRWTSHKLDTQLAKANQIVQLDFVNDKQGWAVVAEQVAGGAVKNGEGTNGTLNQNAASQDAGAIPEIKGALFQTQDGGNTWQRLKL